MHAKRQRDALREMKLIKILKGRPAPTFIFSLSLSRIDLNYTDNGIVTFYCYDESLWFSFGNTSPKEVFIVIVSQ